MSFASAKKGRFAQRGLTAVQAFLVSKFKKGAYNKGIK